MIIDKHIENTKSVIENNNQYEAKKVYDKLVPLYKDIIPNFENGTSVLAARINVIWNMNFDNDKLPTNIDYIADLKLILEKLEMYRETLSYDLSSRLSEIKTTIVNKTIDNSTNIKNSTIKNSNIGNNENKEKKKTIWWKILIEIVTVFAGIAGIVSLILALCDVI